MFSLCSRVFTMFAYIVAKCKFQYICVYTYIYTYIHIYTLDVKSLYTSTPNPEGMAAVKKAHERYQHKIGPTKVITTFLAPIFDLKQLYIQFKVLFTNKRVCNGYYLCPTLCKYFYGLIRREIHLSIN